MAMAAISGSLFAADNTELQKEIYRLQQQTKLLQQQLDRLQTQLTAHPEEKPSAEPVKGKSAAGKQKKSAGILKSKPSVRHPKKTPFHTSPIQVHTVDGDPQSSSFYPTALIADGQVVTYIAGTPVVTAPYLGARPAFDGSDYIVNISSINRDVRLMQQRQRLYRAYERIGYPIPNVPIIALSGKSEPVGEITSPYFGSRNADLTLGSSELDIAAALNDKVEAFMSIAYDETPPPIGGPRIANSAFNLNLGFVNIGDLDVSPYYFTAGQLYAPFGRFSSAMISSPLPLRLTRTKTRPFILGYKSQFNSGPFAAIYGFRSDTTDGRSGVGGVNLGYLLNSGDLSAEIGASYIGTLTDSAGMQDTGSAPGTTFGGFGSPTNGSEDVHKVPGIGIHGNLSFDRYNFTAEWVGASRAFRTQDLSFNGRGARPQAAQLEAGMTFMAFSKPASLAVGYQWSKETLALNLPKHRISGVFNISIWKDTVESLEYRHDTDFDKHQFANGIAPPGAINQTTIGTGKSSDSLVAQIGVYF
nr:LbtU family siderophore porin [Legionella sp. PL877]